ncbi:hypothetical protein Tco_0870837 [Tanacetum coccineum]
MAAFLKKPNESVGLTEIVDFLQGISLRYTLTHNPTIYDSLVKQFWQTATVRTLANRTLKLVASIDNKEYTITESSVRSKLQLADAASISNLPDAEIYDGLATLRLKLEVVEKLLEEEMLVGSSNHLVKVMLMRCDEFVVWGDGVFVLILGYNTQKQLFCGMMLIFGLFETLEINALVEAIDVYGG